VLRAPPGGSIIELAAKPYTINPTLSPTLQAINCQAIRPTLHFLNPDSSTLNSESPCCTDDRPTSLNNTSLARMCARYSSAVRAISLVPECAGGGLGPGALGAGSRVGGAHPPRSYLLLTAGAKEVLMAWRVAWVYNEGGKSGSGGGGDGGGDGSGGSGSSSGSCGGWELRTSLVASRGQLTKRGHVEWRKGCGSVAASTESDQRFMAVTGFFPMEHHLARQAAGSGSGAGVGVHCARAIGDGEGAGAAAPCCLALAAMSEGSVTAMALEGGPGLGPGVGGRGAGARHWRPAAALRHHTRPVLSLAVAAVPLATVGSASSGTSGGGSVAVIGCSGATDGAIAVWDLTALSVAHAASTVAPPPAPMELRPVALIPRSHQSGVNSIGVAPAPGGFPGRLLVASGGDDQALRVTLLSVTLGPLAAGTMAGAEIAVSVAQTLSVDFAHSSAIKGVWMAGGVIATTSHDQRLRVWAATLEDCAGGGEHGSEETTGSQSQDNTDDGGANGDQSRGWAAAGDGGKLGMRVQVTPIAGSFVECPEPEALDAWVGADGAVRIAVSGRGVQMFHLGA